MRLRPRERVIAVLIAFIVLAGLGMAVGGSATPSDGPPGTDLTSSGGIVDGSFALRSLGLPTVIVQEGGYDLEAIGGLVGEALAGIEQGRGGL